jgi:hypothetical protein
MQRIIALFIKHVLLLIPVAFQKSVDYFQKKKSLTSGKDSPIVSDKYSCSSSSFDKSLDSAEVEFEKVPIGNQTTNKPSADFSYTQFTKPKRKVTKIFIHCSDSDKPKHDNIETIREWHEERGFGKTFIGNKKVGYHFFITKGGNIYEGRPLEAIPTAQAYNKSTKTGGNTNTIAICVSGKKHFTKISLLSLKLLCIKINKEYNGSVTFHGHCEVSDKTCPVFDYKKVLNLDAKGNLKT